MKSIKKRYTREQRLDILAGLKAGRRHLAKNLREDLHNIEHDVFICLAISAAYDQDEIPFDVSLAARSYVQKTIGKHETLNQFVQQNFGFTQKNTRAMQKFRKALLDLMIKAFKKAAKAA